jgi:hypothetical protein
MTDDRPPDKPEEVALKLGLLRDSDIARAKAKHRADGCDCGGYFYADGRCNEPGTAVRDDR